MEVNKIAGAVSLIVAFLFLVFIALDPKMQDVKSVRKPLCIAVMCAILSIAGLSALVA